MKVGDQIKWMTTYKDGTIRTIPATIQALDDTKVLITYHWAGNQTKTVRRDKLKPRENDPPIAWTLHEHG